MSRETLKSQQNKTACMNVDLAPRCTFAAIFFEYAAGPTHAQYNARSFGSAICAPAAHPVYRNVRAVCSRRGCLHLIAHMHLFRYGPQLSICILRTV